MGSVALVVLDTSRIRKRSVGALKRARTAYNKAEEEWTFFTEHEEPAFQRWLVIECGPLWSRTRELTEQIQYHRHLLYQMEQEALFSGDSDAACYERAKDRLEHPEKYSDEYEPDELDQDDVDEDQNWNPFGDAWHMDDAEDWRLDIEVPVDAAPSPPIAAEVRLKSIYRELSRRLHPDVNSETTAEQRELWYQVQEAYETKDIDRLELLLTHADLTNGHFSSQSQVGRIIELTMQIRHALRTLRSTIRRARKEPGWGFLSWDESHKHRMSAEAHDQVQLEIQYLEDELQILVEEIDSWKQTEADSSGTSDVFEESILLEVSEEIPHRTCHGKSRRSRSHNEHQTEFQFG